MKLLLLLAYFITPLIVIVIELPRDALGWILVFVSYLLLLLVSEIRKNKVILMVSIVVLTLHHFVSFVNAYIGPTIGADADALTFNSTGRLLASVDFTYKLEVGSGFYDQFLAVVYSIFGYSHFTGVMTSGIAFTLSLIVLVKLMRRMGIEQHQGKILFLFGAIPMIIIQTSVTLRESWQILFFLLSVYSAFRLREKPGVRNFLYLIGSAGALALWHNGLMAFAPLLILLSLWWVFSKKGKQRKNFGRRVTTLMMSALVIGIFIFTSNGLVSSSASDALLSGELIDYSNQYRSSSPLEARATYGVGMSDQSTFGMLKTFPLMFFYYMFAPLPWQVGNALDVYAAGESLLRFLLLYCAYKAWRSETGEAKSRIGYLLIIYLAIEALWSMGTSNWGTAMRHHLIGYGVLLLIGAPALFQKKEKRKSKLPPKSIPFNPALRFPKI